MYQVVQYKVCPYNRFACDNRNVRRHILKNNLNNVYNMFTMIPYIIVLYKDAFKHVYVSCGVECVVSLWSSFKCGRSSFDVGIRERRIHR